MTFQNINLNFDAGPTRIERMEVRPYPDLKRLWVRLQLSPFASPPSIRLLCLDARGEAAAEMLLVEWRDPYVSVTLHLRTPEPGASYLLRAEVARNEELLDARDFPFVLTFS